AMCGYDNEEHFMRQFKKIVGVTPTGYRRKSGYINQNLWRII
ncbi:MAG: AraC family transcriptional regulator, partial [Ruminococcus sp.]|nr:AraC family transcriptional regulator [Ruminococcus sp.]